MQPATSRCASAAEAIGKALLDVLPRNRVRSRSEPGQAAALIAPRTSAPRSGTIMVEQTLSAHSRIAAGDDPPTINELTSLIPRMLASPPGHPEAFADL